VWTAEPCSFGDLSEKRNILMREEESRLWTLRVQEAKYNCRCTAGTPRCILIVP
jgi:hypothetical protein